MSVNITGGVENAGCSRIGKWIAENGTGNKERKYINGIDYLFVTMNDGWIAIFEYSEGYYIPKTQAADEAHALSWCGMIERPRVPFNVI